MKGTLVCMTKLKKSTVIISKFLLTIKYKLVHQTFLPVFNSFKQHSWKVEVRCPHTPSDPGHQSRWKEYEQ